MFLLQCQNVYTELPNDIHCSHIWQGWAFCGSVFWLHWPYGYFIWSRPRLTVNENSTRSFDWFTYIWTNGITQRPVHLKERMVLLKVLYTSKRQSARFSPRPDLFSSLCEWPFLLYIYSVAQVYQFVHQLL